MSVTPYLGRIVSFGEDVRVYRNLGKVSPENYSIQKKVGGRWLVVGHSNELILKDVKFKVSEVGRQRVIKEGRKNVHAFVYGKLVNSIGFGKSQNSMIKISYNPYKSSKFFSTTDGTYVELAKYAKFTSKELLIVN